MKLWLNKVSSGLFGTKTKGLPVIFKVKGGTALLLVKTELCSIHLMVILFLMVIVQYLLLALGLCQVDSLK